MTEFHNIENWDLQAWNKPQKGSRPNNIYEKPDTGELYYFKQSKLEYPSEIWSEIIASKFGQMLGFNLLDYNIGFTDAMLGCLSKTMVNKYIGEELYHGVDILKDYIIDFKITNRPICSFQNWEYICSRNSLFNNFILNFIEIVVFDALIGNTDRHTENWAFISKNSERKIQFSPIYDSGSCLGREILDSKINSFLSNKEKLKKYIRKGKSEIKWNTKTLNLFEILKKVKQQYPQEIETIIKKVVLKATNNNIEMLVMNIDNSTNLAFSMNILSSERKNLIINMLKLRVEFLKEIQDD